jgi:hypothetical protein
MVVPFCVMAEVFLHPLEDLLFVERGADKIVNPIELFWWRRRERNAQVIGYCSQICRSAVLLTVAAPW